MIAIDTSSMIAYLQGVDASDTAILDAALADRTAVLPPVVVTELLSDWTLTDGVAGLFLRLPMLQISGGYWERAGRLRARSLRRKLKARIADTLITQSCLDHDVPLVTRDSDFRPFAKSAGLRLLP